MVPAVQISDGSGPRRSNRHRKSNTLVSGPCWQ
jgi:hypothetical protein